MSRALRLAGAMCALLTACGGAEHPATRLLADRFAARGVAQARVAAPDLIAAAEQARGAAEAAHARGDVDAERDATTCARLYLEAALVESRRTAEGRARATAERAAQAANEAAQRDEAARLAIEETTTRRAAALVAETELARALARAQASEPRRGARLPSGDVEDARTAARALARRARLLLAAAGALGATEAETRLVEAQLTAYQAALAPRARGAEPQIADALAAADAARRAAESVLGVARSRLGAPGPEAVAALVETARIAGVAAQLGERGVSVYAEAFRGAASAPEARAVGALATVLRSHAIGPVLVEFEGSRDAAGARLARTRATRLVRALTAAGIPAARLTAPTLDPAAPPDGVAARAVLVFSAYAVH